MTPKFQIGDLVAYGEVAWVCSYIYEVTEMVGDHVLTVKPLVSAGGGVRPWIYPGLPGVHLVTPELFMDFLRVNGESVSYYKHGTVT